MWLKSLFIMARPKTLSASVVPILVASCLAHSEGLLNNYWISVYALVSAIFIQIATNFFNDAIDFVKGADTAERLGESRGSQSGWLSHRAVMFAGAVCVLIAVVFGYPLVLEGGTPILLVGLISLFLAYSYTGGPFPLAYLGLGDLFVILFFGVIAVGGVHFLHSKVVLWSAVVAGLQVGLLSTVLIAVNNIRDIDCDIKAKKFTLAARLGYSRARWEIPILFLSIYLLGLFWFFKGWYFSFFMPLIFLPFAIRLSLRVLRTPPSKDYNLYLLDAAKIHLSTGVLLGAAFLLQGQIL